MLLTLKPPVQNGIKSPHDFAFHSTNSHYSPPMISGGLPPPGHESRDRRMSNPHRGLPPPAAMSLPPPDRASVDRGLPGMAPLGQLPAPPQQWQGGDESMRNWLQAKTEEERRRQEEEKTRQEGLRLDQRKIEQNMLRESLSGGVPPVMVPIIFAGMSGGTLPNVALEWAQQHFAQMSLQNQSQQPPQQAQPQMVQQAPQQQPQNHQISPDYRRDSRMIPPNPYGGQQPLQPAPIQTGNAPMQSQGPPPSYGRPGPTSAPRLPPQSSLPRLNTGEMHIQGPPTAISHSVHPQQPAQHDSQQSSSPSIYFHHWVPPNQQQSSGNPPPTPSNKSQHGSPFSQTQQSHLRADYQNSPKKRKAAGNHQPPPPPTTSAAERSPPYSQGSSAGTDPESGPRLEGQHSRQHSITSSTRGYDGVPRPSSRQQRQETMSGGTTGSIGQIGGGGHSKQHTPVPTNSEPSLRASVLPETHQLDQSRYTAGPEMRQSIPPMNATPKRED